MVWLCSPTAGISRTAAARGARPEGWRALMNEVQSAAGRLAGRGEVDVTQGGRVVDIAAARGPVRTRRHWPGWTPRAAGSDNG
jgi:hypothetical protein